MNERNSEAKYHANSVAVSVVGNFLILIEQFRRFAKILNMAGLA